MTSDELLKSIRRRARIPTASGLGSQDADLLAMADEETDLYVVPLVLKEREDHWLKAEDVLVTPGASYRMPYRAIGGKVREVSWLNAEGAVGDPPRISIDALENQERGFYLQGYELVFTNPVEMGYLPTTIRWWFYLRPNRLVTVANAATVASFDATARTVTLSSAPAAYAGTQVWDFVQKRQGHDTLAWDAAGTIAGNTITFEPDLPLDLAVGDYVCIAEQTPVPQMPSELHPLLAQRVAVKWLEVNDPAGYDAAAKELERMEGALEVLVSARVEGELQAVTVGNGLFD